MWSGFGPSATLRVLLGPRDPLYCQDFWKQRFSTQPSSGGGRGAFTISRRAVPSLFGLPVLGPLALPLTARFDRGPAYAQLHGAAWLEAAADAVRERGRTQGDTLGALWPADGWRQHLPAGRDGLSLLLCSRELLGKVLNCVAEEAGLGHGGLEEPNFDGCLQHKQGVVQPDM